MAALDEVVQVAPDGPAIHAVIVGQLGDVRLLRGAAEPFEEMELRVGLLFGDDDEVMGAMTER